MPGFWDYATEGFNKGVPLGVRAAERSSEEQRRKREREEDQSIELGRELRGVDERQRQRDVETKRFGIQDKRATEAHTATMKAAKSLQDERDRKQRQDKFRTAYVVAKALADDGKERPAAGMIGKAYSSLVHDGNEVTILAKEDRPNDPKWKDFPEDTQYLVGSPEFGVIPYKSIKDVLKIVEPYAMDSEKFAERERQTDAAIDDKNAAEKPFKGADNKLYVKKWTKTRTGKTAEVVPYEGPAPMSAEEQKVRSIQEIPDSLLSKEGKKIRLGLEKASSQAERTKAEADLIKAKREGKGESAKTLLELTGKQRDQFKKDLDLVFRPFSGGKSVIDIQTGEMTVAGENAIDSARKVVEKGPTDPNYKEAVEALALYKKISTAVKSSYDVDQKTLETEMQSRGFVKSASGSWEKPKKEGVKPKETPKVESPAEAPKEKKPKTAPAKAAKPKKEKSAQQIEKERQDAEIDARLAKEREGERKKASAAVKRLTGLIPRIENKTEEDMEKKKRTAWFGDK